MFDFNDSLGVLGVDRDKRLGCLVWHFDTFCGEQLIAID